MEILNGIGIQILIKAWKKKKLKNFILITNYELFNKYIIENKISLKLLNLQLQIIKYLLIKIYLIYLIFKLIIIIKILLIHL